MKPRRKRFRPQRFDPKTQNYREAFKREFSVAESQHESLVKVHRVVAPRLPDDDSSILKFYDLDRCRMLTFDIDDGGHRAGSGNTGGVTSFFVNRDGEKRTLVMFSCPRAQMTEDDATLGMMVLFHELGHVDDFERGVNVRDGEPMDVVQSELYAHKYCLRLLRERNYLVALAVWMHALETNLGRCGVPNVEKAARLAVASDDFADALRAAGPIYRAGIENIANAATNSANMDVPTTATPSETTVQSE